jgi:uroporphyrinogen-III decarboxylase
VTERQPLQPASTRPDFLTALQRPTADRAVVWTGDLTYWQSSHAAMGDLPERWRGPEGNYRLQLDLGMFPYFQYELFWPYDVRAPSVTVEHERDGDLTRTIIRCPAGALVSESQYLPESFSTATTRYAVQTEADLDVLCAVLEDRTVVPRLDEWRALAERWGEAGYPAVGLPRSPLPALMVEWAGVVNTAYLLADAPREVQRVLDLLERTCARVAGVLAEAFVPVVHFPDNLTSETYAGLYDRWMAPAHRRLLDVLHDAGARAAVHLDGTVRGLLPKLSAAGFDAVESLTPAPVGDVPAGLMRGLAGRPDLVLWGGLPGAAFSRTFPEKAFRRLVAEVLDAWRGEPFILGTADQVPPDAGLDRCRWVSEEVARRGR